MKLATLILSGVLLLTSCSSSSSSIEIQVKLIEYEKCLEKQEVLFQELRKALDESFTLNGKLETILAARKPDPKTGLIKQFENGLENCKAYRP